MASTDLETKASSDLEDRVQVLQNENNEMKHGLTNLREENEDLQHANNFHEVKVSELMEIVTLKSDAVHEKLMDKSLQYAELSMKVDRLYKELTEATTCVKKLGEQREANKRMLLELSDIVRTLQSVKVDYNPDNTNESHLGNQDASLRNVKKKVETIMMDRTLLVTRCKELEDESHQKDEKIAALEAQFHLLNSMNLSREVAATEEVEGEDEKIAGALEAQFHLLNSMNASREVSATKEGEGAQGSISRTSTQTEGDDSSSVSSQLKSLESNKKDVAHFTKDTISCVSETNTHPASIASSSSSSSSCQSSYMIHVNNISTFDESEEIERLRGELIEAAQKYDRFKELCQTAFSRMGNVEQELHQTTDELEDAVIKREKYRDSLKDVIEQYKQLHEEYNEAVEKMESMQETINELQGEKLVHEARASEVLIEDGLAENVDDLIVAYKRAGEKIAALERKLMAAERVAERAESRKEGGDRKLRDAVATYRKVQQEKEDLQVQFEEGEKGLQWAKKDAQKHKEEAKHTRRRLTAYLKKVDKDHADCGTTIIELNRAADGHIEDENVWEDNILHQMLLVEAGAMGRAWMKRHELTNENDRLEHENDELKGFCEEMLNDVGAMGDRQ